METIWKPIKGYENKYEVSSEGDVRSLNFHREKRTAMLSQRLDRYGYPYVELTMNGKGKKYKVHRLVAEAFLEKKVGDTEVDHIDTVRSNNKVENLRWCNISENRNNEITKRHLRGNHAKPVVQKTINGETIRIWDSAAEVSRGLGIDYSCIKDCLDGKQKTSRGYVWERQQ